MNKEELHSFRAEQQTNICQIVAYKDGLEVYSDEWNNYKKDDTGHVMSATKSIVSLLVGIAVTSYFKPTVFDRIDFVQKYIEPIL